MQVFIVQCKLMLRRKSTILAFTISCVLTMTAFLFDCFCFYGADIITVAAAKYRFIGAAFSSSFYYLFSRLFPLIVAIPFSDSFFEERQTRALEYCLTRTTNKQYYYVKLSVVFLSGVLILLLPLVLNYLLNMIAFPFDSSNTSSNLSIPGSHLFSTVLQTDLFGSLFAKDMYLYHLLHICLCSLAGGLIAVAVFQFSFFYRRSRIFLLTAFFLIYHFYSILLSAFGATEFCLENYIFSANFYSGQSVSGLIITFACLVCIAALPIPFAKRKLRDCIE